MRRKSVGKLRNFRVTLIGIGGHSIALINQCLFQQFLKSGHLHKQCILIDSEKSSFSELISGTSMELGDDFKLSHQQVGKIDEMLSKTDLTCLILGWPESYEVRIAEDIAELAVNNASECAAIIFLADKFEALDETKVRKINKIAQKIDRVLIVENRFDAADNIRSIKAFKTAVKIMLYFFSPGGPFLIKKAIKGAYLINFVSNEKTENPFPGYSKENTERKDNLKLAAEMHIELFIDYKTEIRALAEIFDKLNAKIPEDAFLELNFVDMPGEDHFVVVFRSLA